MEEREPSSQDQRAPWFLLWGLIGCGGLLLTVLCLVPPVVWWVLRSTDDEAAVGPELAPAPEPRWPAPEPSPGPSPGSVPGPIPNVPPPPIPLAPDPRRVTATVEEVRGLGSVTVGSTCSFDVHRESRSDGTFWCNAQVRCAGELLYGGDHAGYFDCTLYEQPHRHVVGEDSNTTGTDGDAAMRLNTLQDELVVRDDASGRLGEFEVRARVTEVR